MINWVNTLCALIMVWVPLAVLAQDQQPAKTGADPTDFITRIEPSYEHVHLEDGTDLDLFVVRSDLALRRDLSLRLDLPLLNFDPSQRLDAAGFDSEVGFGDIVTQLLYKPYSDASKAFLFGLRVDLPTASEDELGQGGFSFSPMAIAAWYPRRDLIIAPVFQWTLADDLDNDPLPGERDRNELSYRQIVIWQAMKPYMSWLLLDPELIIDIENDNDTSFVLGAEWGLMTSKRSAIFVKPEVGIGGHTQEDWGIRVGFRYMFPKVLVFKDKASAH